jgi:hypothetical protein
MSGVAQQLSSQWSQCYSQFIVKVSDAAGGSQRPKISFKKQV